MSTTVATPAPELSAAIQATEPIYTDILIAVHGIGDQKRGQTVRSVASRFATSAAMDPGGFAPQPLGFFYRDQPDKPTVRPMDTIDAPSQIGFTEVYWADIPHRIVADEHTLDEIKAWGRTVAARARLPFLKAQKDINRKVKEVEQLVRKAPTQDLKTARKHLAQLRARQKQILNTDLTLASEVVDEIVDTIQILENLSWLLDKTMNIQFDLREVLEEYVGDVQLVTEFRSLRLQIVATFFDTIEKVYAQQKEARKALGETAPPPVRLHIVAHSEGTVVAFLGLLHALSGDEVRSIGPEKLGGVANNTGKPPEWLSAIHGFMTIGSPIDKHLLLWEDLTRGLDLKVGQSLFRDHRIRWRNYYDYGDPVGFRLETARKFLDDRGDKAFEFCNCQACRHDIGFARYLLPGKAHNDYWDDADVFDHFIRNVVLEQDVAVPPPWVTRDWGKLRTVAWASVRRFLGKVLRIPNWVGIPERGKAEIPRTKLRARLAGVSLAYVFSAFLLLLGTWLLYKAVTEFTHPNLELLQRYVAYQIRGVVPESGGAEGWLLFQHSVGLAALIAGTTIAARIPRLAVGLGWRAVLAWLVGAWLYVVLVSKGAREAIGVGFVSLWAMLPHPSMLHLPPPVSRFAGLGTLGTLLISIVVVMLGLSAKGRTRRWGLNGIIEREQRWFRKGARPLILAGAGAILLLVGFQMYRTTAQIDQASAGLPVISPPGGLPAAQFSPEQQTKLLEASPSAWPVLVSGTAFLYLWWLAVLVFDLSFVWNRYVRGGVALQRLREWTGMGFGPDGEDQQTCRHPPPTPPQRFDKPPGDAVQTTG